MENNLKFHGYTGDIRDITNDYNIFKWVWTQKGYVVQVEKTESERFRWIVVEMKSRKRWEGKDHHLYFSSAFKFGVIKALWMGHLRDDDFQTLPATGSFLDIDLYTVVHIDRETDNWGRYRLDFHSVRKSRKKYLNISRKEVIDILKRLVCDEG